MAVALALSALALAAWVYLVLAHGRFWRPVIGVPAAAEPAAWPDVVAVVPARDEADLLPHSLPTLVGQDYPGSLRVIVVDDDSTDGTGDVAHGLGADVIRTAGPAPGWVGKVAAMAAGVAAAGEPSYLLFTDADIAYRPGVLRALVSAAFAGRLDLVSQLARLRVAGRAERATVPAFGYFFAQLYPFARVNAPGARTAAAAGGCMLVRRAALEEAGGLERIRDALIDDVALGRLLKDRGGGIWLAPATDVHSLRAYPRWADVWRMVARSAYTQLRHSPVLLLGTVLGLLVGYAVPPAAAVAGTVVGSLPLAVTGWLAWALMTVSYLPMLRYHRLGLWRAPALPLVAMLYLAMTVDSAWRHARGRGGAWKGRLAAPAPRRQPATRRSRRRPAR